MELTFIKFILFILLAIALLMCLLFLIEEIIKRGFGKKKADSFTNFVDEIRNFLASLTGSF